jgi:hypothetical protein
LEDELSGAQPTEEQIMEAVKASGFLMEQEVATKIEDRGFHVHPARAFEDPDEGKSREIDVWAIRRFIHDEERKLNAYSELIVECKNNNNPYVFITRRKSEADDHFGPPELSFPLEKFEAKKDLGGGRARVRYIYPFDEYGFKEVHPFYQFGNKAVQFCRIDRNGGSWSANHGGLYDAMFLPILKALKSRQADIKPRSIKEEWKTAWFFYPIIVVRGKLLEVDSMAAEPKPVEVPMIPFVRHMKSKKIEGRYLVYFVNEDALPRFIETAVDPMEERLKSIDPDQLLNPQREWRETFDQ